MRRRCNKKGQVFCGANFLRGSRREKLAQEATSFTILPDDRIRLVYTENSAATKDNTANSKTKTIR